MLSAKYLCALFSLAAAFPVDMNRGEAEEAVSGTEQLHREALLSWNFEFGFPEKCHSDGIYWLVESGGMIPCSPTCDEVYTLRDANEVSAKTINEHCKLDTTVGKHYHDIANRTM